MGRVVQQQATVRMVTSRHHIMNTMGRVTVAMSAVLVSTVATARPVHVLM